MPYAKEDSKGGWADGSGSEVPAEKAWGPLFRSPASVSKLNI